jgi:xanthine dehydrogenase accessory factor
MLVLVRGAGDLGTGVAHRLHRAGFSVVVAELPQPQVIRRAVAFASAVYDGSAEVEGVTAVLIRDTGEVGPLLARRVIPVIIDPGCSGRLAIKPDAIVDARMAKQRLDTRLTDAPIVIALGPGYVAGHDAHAVIETMRGHDLGRVILAGTAHLDTGVPGTIDGIAQARVVYAPCDGCFVACGSIGDHVQAGQAVAHVDQQPALAHIAGVLRGILHDGLQVAAGQKVGDVDPRGVAAHCFTISDKARAVGGGVLEAILCLHSAGRVSSAFDNKD